MNGTPDMVRFNIFARLNTGGMPLTHQELRHALVPGRARDVLREWASSDSFRRATDYSIKGDRMADREMVLRYIAFSTHGFTRGIQSSRRIRGLSDGGHAEHQRHGTGLG